MSNHITHCHPSGVRDNVPLRRVPTKIVETEIEDAIQRLGVATSNVYDKISVFSTYWASDNTGADKDSSLFIKTIQKLQNVDAHTHILSQGHTDLELAHYVFHSLPPRTSSRTLFIFHYAGHGIPGTTLITPKIGQKLDEGPDIDLSELKGYLKGVALCQAGLDILFVVDSCLPANAVSGRGPMVKGARVETVAGPRKRLNNALDGPTFTERWCAAFDKLLDTGNSFTSEDIIRNINSASEPKPSDSLIVLREGWGLPITFSSQYSTIESSFSSVLTSQTTVTVFNIKENPDSPSVKKLLEYFNNTPIPITVLATVPISGTLFLLSISVFLQELLVSSGVAFLLED